MLAVRALPARTPLALIDELEDDETAAETQGRLDGVGETSTGAGLHGEAVDDDLDGVLLLLAERRRLVETVHDAVDSRPGVALRLQLTEQVGILPLPLAHHRREHLEARALLERQDLIDNLLRSLSRDELPALRAVRLADAGVQQAQVVVDLRDGADRRAGIARGGLLVDGDCR